MLDVGFWMLVGEKRAQFGLRSEARTNALLVLRGRMIDHGEMTRVRLCHDRFRSGPAGGFRLHWGMLRVPSPALTLGAVEWGREPEQGREWDRGRDRK